MGLFDNKYPYSDFHELNAQWLIDNMKDTAETRAKAEEAAARAEAAAETATVGAETAGQRAAAAAVMEVQAAIQSDRDRAESAAIRSDSYAKDAARNADIARAAAESAATDAAEGVANAVKADADRAEEAANSVSESATQIIINERSIQDLADNLNNVAYIHNAMNVTGTLEGYTISPEPLGTTGTITAMSGTSVSWSEWNGEGLFRVRNASVVGYTTEEPVADGVVLGLKTEPDYPYEIDLDIFTPAAAMYVVYVHETGITPYVDRREPVNEAIQSADADIATVKADLTELNNVVYISETSKNKFNATDKIVEDSSAKIDISNQTFDISRKSTIDFSKNYDVYEITLPSGSYTLSVQNSNYVYSSSAEFGMFRVYNGSNRLTQIAIGRDPAFVNFNLETETTLRLNVQIYVSGIFNTMTESVHFNVMIEQGDSRSDFVPYGGTYKSRFTEYTKNPLYNKKICVNGDSVAYGAGYVGGFGKIIADRNNMALNNSAVSGGTVANTGSERYCISEGVDSLPTDYDYYIFEGGYNDKARSVTIGEYSDSYTTDISTLDHTVFADAFEYMIRRALERFNGKKICFVAIHQAEKTSSQVSALNSYLDMAIRICNKWSVPVLDLRKASGYSIAISDVFNDELFTRASDGSVGTLHPNELGYTRLYVNQIESFLKSL